MTLPANVVDLRDFLLRSGSLSTAGSADRTLQAGSAVSGLPLLQGLDFAPGAVSELVSSAAGTGTGWLLHELLEARAEVVRSWVALVDGADGFDPALSSRRVRERMLWLRCGETMRAVQAADLLLRDGNIPRVLLDLHLCPVREVRGIPAQRWHRMRLLAEKSGVSLCALTPTQSVPCARSRLVLDTTLGVHDLSASISSLSSRLKGVTTRRSSGRTSVIPPGGLEYRGASA
jgi:hypothetical protein